MTGYKRFEDAAEASEGSCGRLDTTTLVDAGGADTTVRRGRQSLGLARSERALGQTLVQ